MLGLSSNKNKPAKAVEDESIRDKSKFVVVGFVLMVLSLFFLVGGEIYTSVSLSKQKEILEGSGDVQEEADNIVLEMAKLGKQVNDAEYKYIEEIMKFMSPTEFQNFKNSISGLANQFSVQINSLNEGKSKSLGDKFYIAYIDYQFLSSYDNLVFLKDKIAETKFKVNIEKEKISRENSKSNRILAQGTIGVYVFKDKDSYLESKKNIIDKYSKAKEENKTENSEEQKNN